ncbi:MAG: DUF3943 domain-containing protein [Caldimonas sp.]
MLRSIESVAAAVLLAALATGGPAAFAQVAAPSSGASSAQATAERSDWIPALEIVGFDFLLNRFERSFGSDRNDYRVDLRTVRRNLGSGWGTDRDPFKTNQLGHPYQGSMYHGFARSTGHDYWASAGYAFAGSAFWEIAGERTRPSRNDQVASGIGGTFFGEALFRMSNLLLEQGGGLPRFWREAAAAAISPSSGFNRLAYGDRFGGVFSSRDAAYFSRLQFGYAHDLHTELGSSSANVKKSEGLVDFSIDYGLPGAKGYQYTRPFDYFNFQVTASTANGFENLATRGLLVGAPYEIGDAYRGVWGLYGSYDYLAPQTFRVSTTAVSLGSTAQWWLSDTLSLQGTAMAGLGYAAVGTTRGAVGERDYNYGVAPQALLALRLTHGDKTSLDVTAREYFFSSVASGTSGGHDNIVRADASLTVRLSKQQAVAVRYLGTRRNSSFDGSGSRQQSRSTIGVYYTLLGQDRFGTVDWR